MKPPHAAGEDLLPVEVAGLELRGRLVRTVVEDDRRAHAVTAIAVHRGDVGAGHAVVGKALEERLDAHRSDPLTHQIADRVVDHRGRDGGLEAKAIGEVRRYVELATADVDLTLGRLAERDVPRVEPVNDRAQGQKIQRSIGADVQAA